MTAPRALEKDANWVTGALKGVRSLVTRGATKAAPEAATAAAKVAPAATGTGWRHGLSEFKTGLTSGKRFGVGASDAASAAPSLWRSVGHNVADQAVGGAVGGAVLGGAMGAYQAPKGEGFAGALAGAGEGAKAGVATGVLAGAAGGAMRHGRYKALIRSGQSHEAAHKVMSKTPWENAKDAWEQRGTPGAWHADAIEAAAVPATVGVEMMAQGIGEMKPEKKASDLDLAATAVIRAVKQASAAHPYAPLVVVPMLDKARKTPEQVAHEKKLRDQLENDQAVARAIGPLTGTIGTEAMLRAVVDPAVKAHPGGALTMFAPDSVPRKILLPGLGAALGAYGAHKIVQARREAREREEAATAAPPSAAPVVDPHSQLGAALIRASND